MIKPRPPAEMPATEVIEEAIALLRRTPASVVLCSVVGGVPFWLALLYFLADMSRDAFAAERLAGASLSLAVLYLWKKCWEAVFATGLLARLAETPAKPWTARRVSRLVLGQAETQFWGLFIRPLAYNLLLPSAWISAYYQNATILWESRPGETGALSSRAWTQARLWPLQNHLLLSVLGFFFFFAWVNVTALCGAIPWLLKTLLGIETMASRHYGSLFSTTFFTATGAVTMLAVDPIWRAAYVVRCFHGTSLQSGADLRSSLRGLRARAAVAVALVVLGLSAAAPAAMKSASPPALDATTLDHSIEQTLERREFAWRFRRIDSPETKQSSWLDAVVKWLAKMKAKLKPWLKDFGKWLEKLFRWDRSAEPASHFEIPPLDWLLYAAAALVALILGWLGYRHWRRPRRVVVTAEIVAPLPDLNARDLVADQLPEEGWLALARELAGRGELRLALRAAYLASLALLGERKFVAIARHKSNRDYQRELRRRARAQAALLTAFDENLTVFESAWYGDHQVTPPVFAQFTQNLERIRAC